MPPIDLIQPPELASTKPDPTGRWRGCDVWTMLVAARSGDVATLRRLLVDDPGLVHAEFWYMPPIHFAVREGQVAATRLLVEAGADVTYASTLYGNDTLLTMARERGHEPLIAYLENVLQERCESTGREQLIHDAVSAGQLAQVESLLAAEPALAHCGDHRGRRPLHRAVETSRVDLVRCLLDHGAAVDAPGFSSDDRLGGDGFRPIDLALWKHPYWAQRNDYVLAQYLLQRGAAYTITIAAALGDTVRVGQLLAKDHTLANDAEPCGKRPLSAAAERGFTAIVRQLLEHGANPTLAEGRYCPRGYALWAAARGGHHEMAEALLHHGADPNAGVDSSGSPLDAAKDDAMRALLQRHGGKLDVMSHVWAGHVAEVTALLDTAPDLFRSPSSDTPFTAVVSSGNQAMLQLLLDRGVRVPAMVTCCHSYLWSNLELARILLEHDMNPSLPNWQRITPLHHMARKGEIEKARLFVEFGADVNAIDEEYRGTPLGWAARFGQKDMVEFLLVQGANPAIAGADWATPLAWAETRGHGGIAELLRNRDPEA